MILACQDHGVRHCRSSKAGNINGAVQAGGNPFEPRRTSLHRIAGRRAGALEDFRYSRAMARFGITWTAETLDAYLADPPNWMPGNRMPFAGIPDAALRRDIVAYLLTLR